MPRKAKPKGEIEVFFGIKQVLVIGILLAVVLGGAYFWGFEAGHKRALAGKPSLLAFLESSAASHTDTVQIPNVLLDPVEALSPRAAEPVAHSKPSPAEGLLPPPGSGASPKAARDRVKPQPGLRAAPDEPEPDAPQPQSDASPAPAHTRERAVARTEAGGTLHYQVAALSVRKNAKSLADWLRSEGFEARILPERDGLFRVYVGPFRDDAEAANAKDRLRKDGFQLMARQL